VVDGARGWVLLFLLLVASGLVGAAGLDLRQEKPLTGTCAVPGRCWQRGRALDTLADPRYDINCAGMPRLRGMEHAVPDAFEPVAHVFGPDGRVYAQANLARTGGEQTWRMMLVPPDHN